MHVIQMTVADHLHNGFVTLAQTSTMSLEHAQHYFNNVTERIDKSALPDENSDYWFLLDIFSIKAGEVDTHVSELILPLQEAFRIAYDDVQWWLNERPRPSEVLYRLPSIIPLDRLDE